ncbi:DUF5689 domain-containing protein [Marinifilum fragile]|uniref:DUF5689 domain-containing protein n=1 Tax=Marinifilum fragile TaxID=570161 RepID=UPI002AA8136E|nr:DUF5689 domain-containing protein [Marinifilum fragile]
MKSIKKFFYAALITAGLATSFVACVDNDFDQPEIMVPKYEGTSNTSIADLKAKHTAGQFETIEEDLVIEGYVVSDDTEGNFYKQIIVQDSREGATGGIEVKINEKGLSSMMKPGQQVFIKVKGLVMGDYNGLIQLGGGTYQDGKYTNLAGIDPGLIKDHIFLNGLPVELQPKEVTLEELKDNDLYNSLVSTLVKITSAQFADADGNLTYAEKDKSVNRDLVGPKGNKLIVRNSGYSNFYDEVLPQGSGSIVGVLSKFGNDKQMMIRSTEDVDMTGDRFEISTGGDVNTGTDKVFISEYAEGSSNNKYIEIYNGTEGDIDLANYTLRAAPNGGEWTDPATFTGTLAKGAVYVVCTDAANAEIKGKANLELSYPSPVHFNGDDAVGLFKKDGENWTLIDVVGKQGEKPENGWDVAGVTAATKDHTLIRKLETTQSNPDWSTNINEWIVADKDDFTNLGVFGESTGGGNTDQTAVEKIFISEYAEGSSNNKYIEIYNGSTADIDLANFTLRSGPNGEAWGDAIELSGTLAKGSVYVICADAANADIKAKANLELAYPSPVHFNGDDAVGLFKKDGENWILIDVIGKQGERPENGWDVAGVTAATKDHTLIRKNETTQSNPDWSTAVNEWTVADMDDFTNLGVFGDSTGGGDTGGDATPGVNLGNNTVSGASDLFISEYLEGSSNNKYLEIYNGTGAEVDLSNYSIKVGANGKMFADATDIPLSGKLPNGATFLIANSSAALTLPDGITATTDYSTATYFNGDDAVALLKSGTVIDVFGVEGEDPGSSWDVEGVAGATANHTLARKSSVSGPNTTWTTSEWEVKDNDTVSGLGSHTMN